MRLSLVLCLLVTASVAEAQPDWDAEEARIAALPHARGIAHESMRDRDLRSAHGAVKRPVAMARRVASADPRARLQERRYELRAFRLGPGELGAALEGMARAHHRPDPTDFVFYARIEPLADPDAAALAAAIDCGSPLGPAEHRRRDALAARLAAELAARPSLRAFVVHAGWGDAVGSAFHGVALVDSTGREALWIHAIESWGFD